LIFGISCILYGFIILIRFIKGIKNISVLKVDIKLNKTPLEGTFILPLLSLVSLGTNVIIVGLTFKLLVRIFESSPIDQSDPSNYPFIF
jgi:hypothetical protein